MASTMTVPKKLWYKYIQYMRKFDLITINEKNLTVNIVKIWIENYGDFHLEIQLVILRLFEANMASRVYY